MRKYTTRGSVRGRCGHDHTLRGAVACSERDDAACSTQGATSYSDRNVVRRDGAALSDAETSRLVAIASESGRRKGRMH